LRLDEQAVALEMDLAGRYRAALRGPVVLDKDDALSRQRGRRQQQTRR
jgi:hypothetical protein